MLVVFCSSSSLLWKLFSLLWKGIGFNRHALKGSRCKKVSVGHSAVSDLAIPWTVAHQAPLSIGFPRQEY